MTDDDLIVFANSSLWSPEPSTAQFDPTWRPGEARDGGSWFFFATPPAHFNPLPMFGLRVSMERSPADA